MKNKNIIKYLLFIGIILVFVILIFFIVNYIRVKNAKIEVNLIDDLTLEFNDSKKVSDFIKDINGKIINNYEIDSKTLGEKKIKFYFINDDKIKVSYTYTVNVVDTVAPVVFISSSYNLAVGNKDTIVDNVLCGDNYDSNPKCEVIGDYDTNTTGSYPLVFKATDKSGNVTEKNFNLRVYEPVKSVNKASKTETQFTDVISNYKSENTKIGIDVSGWQKDIDFEQLKNAGVEFVIIKVGGTLGTNLDFYVDSKFTQNIENAIKYGIDIGIYFHSYASSSKETINEAKWVMEQLKPYKDKITLPIAFDWEDWSDYNSYNLSFFGLTSMAEDFIKEVEKNGYTGMLYSSKTYLENIWLPTKYDIWLAHYTEHTSYTGKYKFWQICDDGVIDGISTPVDIDIMYMEN